jgi:NAD(P)H-dependent FMN reductase
MSLNTAVVYGSARRNRQGIKAARFIVHQLEARDHQVDLVDSGDCGLPMLDLMYKEYAEGEAPDAMARVADIFRKADGFIIVSAEYNHSIPAALKNLLDHFQTEYLYKPSGLVTYSAGPFGGVRALVNLRGIMAELGAPAIPSAFPISKVQSAFDEEGIVTDAPYDQRVTKFLDEYEWYANALKAARGKERCETGTPVQQALCRG